MTKPWRVLKHDLSRGTMTAAFSNWCAELIDRTWQILSEDTPLEFMARHAQAFRDGNPCRAFLPRSKNFIAQRKWFREARNCPLIRTRLEGAVRRRMHSGMLVYIRENDIQWDTDGSNVQAYPFMHNMAFFDNDYLSDLLPSIAYAESADYREHHPPNT